MVYGETVVSVPDSMEAQWPNKKSDSLKLAWTNINYSVPAQKDREGSGEKQILRDMNGIMNSGEVTALMGPSGAGKSSLMNIIAGRSASGNASGNILVNDRVMSKSDYKDLVAYVPQDDVFLPFLTVRETLQTAAELKLDARMTKKERVERIDQVLKELGLRDCQHAIVGSAMVKGISGGQRKRLAIGVELLHNPRVLFLDEPTSGLDSETSESVMKNLKALSQSGRIVMCTIHQPKYEIFRMFDRLIVLSGGQTAYNGYTKNSIDYLQQIGYPVPEFINPADHFMKVVSPQPIENETDAEVFERLDGVCKKFASSNENTSLMNRTKKAKGLESFMADGSNIIGEVEQEDDGFMKEYRADYQRIGRFRQFQVLYKRAFRSFIRDKPTNFGMAINNIVFPILIGILFFQLPNSEDSVRDRQGAIFNVIVTPTFSIVMSTINFMISTRDIMVRERAASSYKVLPFFLAQSLADLPVLTFWIIISGTIQYWMIGLKASALSYFLFLGFFWASQMAAYSFGILLASLSPNANVAFTLAPLINVVLMVVGGFYISLDNMPSWISWLKWISYIQYAFSAVVTDQFTGETYDCGNQSNCLQTGEEVIEDLGIPMGISSGMNFLYIMILAVGWRVVAYFYLLWGPTKPRAAV
eukprot:Nk52_evm18s162 gene=Nk52_evmTU18s162